MNWWYCMYLNLNLKINIRNKNPFYKFKTYTCVIQFLVSFKNKTPTVIKCNFETQEEFLFPFAQTKSGFQHQYFYWTTKTILIFSAYRMTTSRFSMHYCVFNMLIVLARKDLFKYSITNSRTRKLKCRVFLISDTSFFEAR